MPGNGISVTITLFWPQFQSSGRDNIKDTDTIISDQEKRYYGRIRVMSSKMTQRAKGMQRGLSEEVSLELPSKDEDPAK